jgi:hypothetical protein
MESAMKTTSVRKRTVRKSANSPEPTPINDEPVSSLCGHSHCGDMCRVRYIGPTSHIRDHHILHTARGMTHVWTAAIIAGLAIVITGAAAFSVVNAQNRELDSQRSAQTTEQVMDKLNSMENRLDVMEKTLANQPATQGVAASPKEVFPDFPQQ